MTQHPHIKRTSILKDTSVTYSNGSDHGLSMSAGSILDKCATDRMADEISDYLTYGMHHSTQEAKSKISQIIRGENK